MNTKSEVPPLGDWHPLEEFAEQHPNLFTVAALRWQLRRRNENGLASAVVRSGNKLLISKSRYERWLAARADQAAA